MLAIDIVEIEVLLKTGTDGVQTYLKGRVAQRMLRQFSSNEEQYQLYGVTSLVAVTKIAQLGHPERTMEDITVRKVFRRQRGRL